MEWSNDLILEFLELYEREPKIWNPRNPQYKDRNAVHDAWKRIENRLSVKVSVKELKKKKESLMATFRKLASKEKASMRRGSGTDEVYKPDWFAYEIMAKFLHGIYTPNKTTKSEGVPDETNTDNAENNEEHVEPGDTDHTENDANIATPSTSTEKPENSDRTFKTPTPTVGNRKRKAQVEQTESRMEEAYQFFKKMSNKPDQDGCSLYAELLAKKLRALDENTREIAMHEIDNLIYRLKQQKNQLPYPSPYIHQLGYTSVAGGETFTYPPPHYYPYYPIHFLRQQPSPGNILQGPYAQIIPQYPPTAPSPHSQPPPISTEPGTNKVRNSQ